MGANLGLVSSWLLADLCLQELLMTMLSSKSPRDFKVLGGALYRLGKVVLAPKVQAGEEPVVIRDLKCSLHTEG